MICKQRWRMMCCMGHYTIQTADQLKPIIAGFRTTAGLTQEDLAMRLGVTQQTYSVAERNAANMSVGKLLTAQGRPLSLTLPFIPGNQPHRGELVRAWFDNLLPDSPRLRDRMAARFKTQDKSAFDLLAEVGRDSVGAVRLLPEGFEADDDKTTHAQPMTNAEIAQLLRNTVSSQVWSGDALHAEDFRISLAGAQEKRPCFNSMVSGCDLWSPRQRHTS